MSEYVVIKNFDPNPATRYKMDALPLHISISNMFYSSADESFLCDRLLEVAESTKPFTIKATSRQQFGKEMDVPVTELEKSDEIQTLHASIISTLGDVAVLKTPEFGGNNYRPHVTDQPVGKLAIGSVITIDSLTLVKVVDHDVFVLAVYELRK
jgi:2'-5' RNA ligase